jgi:hypothetical protein
MESAQLGICAFQELEQVVRPSSRGLCGLCRNLLKGSRLTLT